VLSIDISWKIQSSQAQPTFRKSSTTAVTSALPASHRRWHSTGPILECLWSTWLFRECLDQSGRSYLLLRQQVVKVWFEPNYYLPNFTNSSIAVVLARVFVNKNTTTMYFHLFSTLFPLLEQTGNFQLQWTHIHSTGIDCVIADMCHKQAPGKNQLILYSISYN
jgi:hypothetical protein